MSVMGQRVGVSECRRGKETCIRNGELRIGGLRLRFWMGGVLGASGMLP